MLENGALRTAGLVLGVVEARVGKHETEKLGGELRRGEEDVADILAELVCRRDLELFVAVAVDVEGHGGGR